MLSTRSSQFNSSYWLSVELCLAHLRVFLLFTFTVRYGRCGIDWAEQRWHHLVESHWAHIQWLMVIKNCLLALYVMSLCCIQHKKKDKNQSHLFVSWCPVCPKIIEFLNVLYLHFKKWYDYRAELKLKYIYHQITNQKKNNWWTIIYGIYWIDNRYIIIT